MDAPDPHAMCRQLVVQLRACREATGLSQNQLADMIGVETKLVGKWEQGTRWPRMFHLMCWAAALGVARTEVTAKQV